MGSTKTIQYLTACLIAFLWLGSLLPRAAFATGDFSLIDQHGAFHQLSRYADREAVVIFVQRNGDPLSRRALPILEQLREQYGSRDVVFLLLNADAGVDRDAVHEEGEREGIDFPILIDGAQVVATTLGAERVGEVFVLDPGSEDLLFRGSLEQSDGSLSTEWLENALQAATTFESLSVEAAESSGPPIDFVYRRQFEEQGISYEHDVAPVLQQRCAHCHVDQGLAPWAMDRYLMVMGWSPMMRETIITRRMPPGQLDGHIGNWVATHELSDEEQALLVHWIDAGAPRGDDEADPLAEQLPATDTWPLGEPDLIVDVPEEEVPATGVVDFLVKTAELSLDEDRWVRAVAYDIGDKSVLHSLLVYALDRDLPVAGDADLIDPDNATFFSIFVPGESVDAYRPDSGFLLRADQDLSFKIKYLSSGRATVDRTRVGLYFHDSEPEKSVRTLAIRNSDIDIPENQPHHVEVAETEAIEREFYFDSFSPHAHNRAQSMRFFVLHPDGRQELLANVANYNFNWQLAYTLEESRLLPAGSRLMAETVYNNSDTNPFNPDPDIRVGWGVSTYDEMFDHYIRILQERR